MTICSLEALAAAEPLSGTAPYAARLDRHRAPGPWGRDAVADSRLPEPVRTTPAGGQGRRGVGPAGPSSGPAGACGPARAATSGWPARSPAGCCCGTGCCPTSCPCAAWDIDGDRRGLAARPRRRHPRAAPARLHPQPSAIDAAPSTAGRSLTSLREAATPEQRSRIWECSHVGGHRFAPVTLSLPSGAVHGRLDTAEAADLLRRHEEGRVWSSTFADAAACSPPARSRPGPSAC